MSKNTQKNIKVYAFITVVIAYVIGASIVGLPAVELETILQIAYYGIGGGLLVWATPKLF